jgi:hypothetical protein
MGDHRSRSSDSRAHISDANSGTVPQDKVIGRAFVIVWPVDRARLLSVPDTFDGVVALGAVPAAALASTPYALGLIGALPVLALRRRLTARRTRRAADAAVRGAPSPAGALAASPAGAPAPAPAPSPASGPAGPRSRRRTSHPGP